MNNSLEKGMLMLLINLLIQNIIDNAFSFLPPATKITGHLALLFPSILPSFRAVSSRLQGTQMHRQGSVFWQ